MSRPPFPHISFDLVRPLHNKSENDLTVDLTTLREILKKYPEVRFYQNYTRDFRMEGREHTARKQVILYCWDPSFAWNQVKGEIKAAFPKSYFTEINSVIAIKR